MTRLSPVTAPVVSLPGASCAAGVRVLKMEAEALLDLAESLDARFEEAVTRLAQASGRVIVSGMGKSGHVGRKIAATLASTGTPAFFVHPAEASHGDLGMIVDGDVVLALSNSGESRELNDLIAYTRRYAIPLIAVTSQAASTLGRQCDVLLLLPQAPEACPNGLAAPTTSTTLTLALGDALAVALLERKGFTAKDFRVFHPGGKLGQQLMRVSEIMHEGAALPLVADTASLRDVVAEIGDKGFGCAIVVDAGGRLAGIVTDGDIRRAFTRAELSRQTPENVSVRLVMSNRPWTVRPDSLVAEAMALMNGLAAPSGETPRRITSLVVSDEQGRPSGLLHLHDCLRAGFA